ncbi:MAG: MBL fold metallo-hydrolase [Porticoccaceae bacterium]|nr:MBL fold metallo-hydrolase [Porticoccaceae bacterium]
MRTKMLFLWFILALVATSASMAGNRVSVLHNGYVTPIDGYEFLPGATDSGKRKVGSTVTLVEGKNTYLIADPGMAAKGAWPKILAELALRGLTPDDITHVFISHHHPDHNTQLGLFPKAVLVDHWASYRHDIWTDHPDNYAIAPGITVVRTPGHTSEDASLIVDTAEGVYALTHLWWAPEYFPKDDPLGQDKDAMLLSRQKIAATVDWIIPGHGTLFAHTRDNQQPIAGEVQAKVKKAVWAASARWIKGFNAGDAQRCADAYEAHAEMIATPFGRFVGRAAIKAFWQNLIDQGFSDVTYIEPKIEVISARAAIITSGWSMNKAQGIITKELWVLQEDGTAKLRIDLFEAFGD